MNIVSKIDFFYKIIKNAFTEISANLFIKTLILNYNCFIQLDDTNFKLATNVFRRNKDNVLEEISVDSSNKYDKKLEYLFNSFNSSLLNQEGSHITNIVRISPFNGKMLKGTIPRHDTIKQGTSNSILDLYEIYHKHFWNTVESKPNTGVPKNKSQSGELKDIEEISEEELYEIEFKKLLIEEEEEGRKKSREEAEAKHKSLIEKANNLLDNSKDEEFKSLLKDFLKEKFGITLTGPYKSTRSVEAANPDCHKMFVLKYKTQDRYIPLNFEPDFNNLDVKNKALLLLEENIKSKFSSMHLDNLKDEFVKFLIKKNIVT